MKARQNIKPCTQVIGDILRGRTHNLAPTRAVPTLSRLCPKDSLFPPFWNTQSRALPVGDQSPISTLSLRSCVCRDKVSLSTGVISRRTILIWWPLSSGNEVSQPLSEKREIEPPARDLRIREPAAVTTCEQKSSGHCQKIKTNRQTATVKQGRRQGSRCHIIGGHCQKKYTVE